MKIVRASINDTDLFSSQQLIFGACCFFTEDKIGRYFFEINGREATLYTNTKDHIAQAIDEFLFYSGFITTIKDKEGRILAERTPNIPCLHEISKIQPSQFYISEDKLSRCKTWIRSSEDILVPVIVKDGKTIALDGHTRLRAAVDLGFDSAYVYTEESSDYIFKFVDEAVKRGVLCISDMEIISEEDYNTKWHKFCDTFFGH